MLHGFDGRVGDSDLGGDADVAYVNKRRRSRRTCARASST